MARAATWRQLAPVALAVFGLAVAAGCDEEQPPDEAPREYGEAPVPDGGDEPEEEISESSAGADHEETDEGDEEETDEGGEDESDQGVIFEDYSLTVDGTRVTEALTVANPGDEVRAFELVVPVLDREWLDRQFPEYMSFWVGTRHFFHGVRGLGDYEVSTTPDVEWERGCGSEADAGSDDCVLFDESLEAGQRLEISVEYPTFHVQDERGGTSTLRLFAFVELDGETVVPTDRELEVCDTGFGDFVAEFGESVVQWRASNPRICIEHRIETRPDDLAYRLSDGCFVADLRESEQPTGMVEAGRSHAWLRLDSNDKCDALGAQAVEYGEPTGGGPYPRSEYYPAWCRPHVGEVLELDVETLEEDVVEHFVLPAAGRLSRASDEGSDLAPEDWNQVPRHLRYWHKVNLMRYLRAYIEARRGDVRDESNPMEHERFCLKDVEEHDAYGHEEFDRVLELFDEYEEQYLEDFERAHEDVKSAVDSDVLSVAPGD